MTAGDVDGMLALAADAFGDLDRRRGAPQDAGPPPPPFPGRWYHLLDTDPEGLWVAEDAEGLAGGTAALRRDGVWGLSLLAVRVGTQSRGIGAALLERALATAEGADTALIVSSTDPRAIRRYARAGFALRPTLLAGGVPSAAALPREAGTRLGEASDLDLTVAVDRRVRGAGRPADLATVLDAGGLLVVADGPGRGYALLRNGNVMTLAADDEDVAARVLARALREVGGERTEVRWIDAAQGWAVGVVLDAGLALEPSGPLCVAGARPAPLTPYLPSGAYL
jgi:GNAT superfamily N-acetyltransferase